MASLDSSTSPLSSTPGRVLAHRYHLVRLIGIGPDAHRWDAHDDVLDRAVAATIFAIDAADPEVEDQFRRHAAIAARLRHPNIIATLDADVDGATAFVIEERSDAPTIREMLTTGGPFRPARAVAIVAEVCAALEAVHAAGRTHRGLTTANIVVCAAGTPSAGSAKLADVVLPGWTSGTAPAARTANGTSQGDLASAGALLYELVTGVPPGVDPKPPRQLRAGVPNGLERAIHRALGLEGPPFTDASDLRRTLLALGLGVDDAEPAVDTYPTPPSGVPTAFRKAKRRWVATAAILIFIAGALTLLGVSLGRSEMGHRLLDPPQAQAGTTPLTVVGVHSFDPDGDGNEKDDRAALVIDGDLTTTWATESYRAPLARLKRGVGLVLDLDAARRIERIRVAAGAPGWSAEIYVSDDPHPDLHGWGERRGHQVDAPASASIDITATTADHVLVWFTELGPGKPRLEVVEINVEGRG